MALAAAIALAAPLLGCAQEPLEGWRPPAPVDVPGVALLAGGSGAGGIGDAGGPPDAEPVVVEASGLVGGRLRNDKLPFAARFVYIPGAPAFNKRVNSLLRAAIEATGKKYAPQVHSTKAGLSDRGCVPGSASWPDAEVLSRPETGPKGGAGTAVTCEVTAAFATTVVVVLRVVTGGPERVTADTSQTLVVDIDAGTVAEAKGRWSEEAPAELWVRVIELLRQRAGGLSSAPIAPPDEEQLELARRALDSARHVGGAGEGSGALDVMMPAGIGAPELAGLGGGSGESAMGKEPLTFRIDAETVREWSSAQQRALLDGGDVPFVGAGAARVPIDCALIPCIALTYDDGPSRFTPKLLDTLKSKGARATFFMIGRAAAGDGDTVRRVHAEGHEIGSHTMTHADLTKLAPGGARAEVLDAAEILRRATGARVATYRPPYGAVNQRVLDEVGLPAILWSIDTNDWRDPGADALRERGVNWPTTGDIVLFHDTHAGTVDIAGEVIDGLRDRGFEPVTVTELFGGSVPTGRVSGR